MISNVRRRHAVVARISLACALVLAFSATPASAYDRPYRSRGSATNFRYWYAPAQDKVYQNTPAPTWAAHAFRPQAPTPSAGRLPLFMDAARGESEGRQLMIRPVGGGVKDVWVEPSDLVIRDGGGIVSRIASDNVSAYKVHYVQITTPSYGYSQRGPQPDPLIPMTLANGQRLGWRPDGQEPYLGWRSVGRNTTQPFYVRFEVPDDAAPGRYMGSLRVTCTDEHGDPLPAVRIPVFLTVRPFSVAQRTLKTSFGVSLNRAMAANSASGKWLPQMPSLPPDAGRVPERTSFKGDQVGGWLRFMGEHRVSPQTVFTAWDTGSDGLHPDDDGDMISRDDYLEDYLGTGQATTFDGERLAFNTVCMPEYAPPSYIKNPFASSAARLAAAQYYSSMWTGLGSYRSKAYAYPVDEPTASQRSFVEQYAAFIHQYAPGSKVLLTTDPITMAYRPLSGIDIYVHKLHFYYRDYSRWVAPLKSSGKEVWIYPHATTAQKDVPMFLIDKPLSESRALGWFAFHGKADGLLYWNVCAWRHDGSSAELRDPYTEPYVRLPVANNGDGTLVYPGYYPALGLVLEGAPPVGSLRMEALRDGLEDYEYLKLVESRYGRSTADAYAGRIIGKAVGVYSGGKPTFPSYSKTASSYESVRRDMAKALSR